MVVIARVAALSIGDISMTVSRAVMICPFVATPARRAARLTASPKTSPSRSTTGPWLKPMRMPICVLPTGGISEIALCISMAASAAASAVGKADITSSPIVLITRPLAVMVFSRIRFTHFSMAACATASPAVSYSFVLPLTSANSTDAWLTCSAIYPAGLPFGVIVPGSKKNGAPQRPVPPRLCCLFTGHALAALLEAIGRRDASLIDAMIHRRRRADVAGEAVVDLLRHRVGRLRVLQGLRRDLRHRRADRRRHREHARACRTADATIVVEHVRAGVLRARRERRLRRGQAAQVPRRSRTCENHAAAAEYDVQRCAAAADLGRAAQRARTALDGAGRAEPGSGEIHDARSRRDRPRRESRRIGHADAARARSD